MSGRQSTLRICGMYLMYGEVKTLITYRMTQRTSPSGYRIVHVVCQKIMTIEKWPSPISAKVSQRFLSLLKAALQQAPGLRLPDFTLRFILTTIVSATCCGGVVSHVHDDDGHPLAFSIRVVGDRAELAGTRKIVVRPSLA
ncbi:RNase H-like domain found in reverse transcriptase [Phytophthora infestans]|uniref:RNase H-like domain found in reverse transcriptase n=1 Tax=Phytophthora infestans TaxID=4787 RepID=A0A833WN77_PHYIN|nr:RNase H-like domain found in reverse transcriptase [Phytophthora infestans]